MNRHVKRVTKSTARLAMTEMLEGVRSYLRVEVEGIEHLPKRGRAVLIANHSGCAGLDAVMLAFSVFRERRRMPRILALWSIFQLFPFLAPIGRSFGLRPASAQSGLEMLRKGRLTLLFPEGVKGSFKPFSQRYCIQPFHTGFIRLALLTDAPIIPAVVIGAEESNINLGAIQFGPLLKGLALPIPVNMIPLPAKWKIKFLPPLDLSRLENPKGRFLLKPLTSRDAMNREKIQNIAESVRRRIQGVVDEELKKREFVFFRGKAGAVGF